MKAVLVAVALVAFAGLFLTSAQAQEIPSSSGDLIGVAYCPNNCSYPFGECDENYGCRCDASHGTEDCSVPIIPITSFQRVSGPLTAGKWALYSMQVTDSQIQLLITLGRTAPAGDPDLYVRYNALPDRTHYDFADFSTAQVHTTEVSRPALQTGTYYIGVYAYGSSDTAFEMEPRLYECPNDCNKWNNQGVCNPTSHACTCNPGWVLNDCSAFNQPLNQPVSYHGGSLGALKWVFYEIDISPVQFNNDIDLEITVNAESSTQLGSINLFIARDRFPTATDFDYYSTKQADEQSVKVCSSQLFPGKYHIGVENFGYSYVNYTLRSDVISNCPNQCSGHGSCNSITGLCHCESAAWGGNDCSVNVAAITAGRTTVGTVVGLSFFFLILGAGPFIVWKFFGDKIKGWWRGVSVNSSESGNVQSDFPAASEASRPATGASSYATF